jgi:hypothetical protein
VPLTLEELKEKLAEQIDEITLLDMLGITSYDLVERFEDVIEDKFEKLEREIDG